MHFPINAYYIYFVIIYCPNFFVKSNEAFTTAVNATVEEQRKAGTIGFAAYGLARLLIPELSRKIEQDNLPAAAMLAVIAVISGTLAAASMTA